MNTNIKSIIRDYVGLTIVSVRKAKDYECIIDEEILYEIEIENTKYFIIKDTILDCKYKFIFMFDNNIHSVYQIKDKIVICCNLHKSYQIYTFDGKNTEFIMEVNKNCSINISEDFIVSRGNGIIQTPIKPIFDDYAKSMCDRETDAIYNIENTQIEFSRKFLYIQTGKSMYKCKMRERIYTSKSISKNEIMVSVNAGNRPALNFVYKFGKLNFFSS